MKFKLILFLLCCLTPCILMADALSLNQISEACCRIQAGASWGTGSCIAETENEFLILTSAHVINNSTMIRVEFFKDGYKSKPIVGVKVYSKFIKGTDVDFAIIAVTKSALGGYTPRVIPLVPKNTELKESDYIASGGCPQARWVQLWEGRITAVGDQQNGQRLIFLPDPLGGQSGSGVFVNLKDEQGNLHTRLGAVITYRIENPGQTPVGGAIPIATLYGLLVGTHTPTVFPAHYQPLSERICSRCGLSLEEHALGIDGQYYCKTKNSSGQWVVQIPKGLTIINWGKLPGGGGLLPPNNLRPNPTPSPDNTIPSDPFDGKLIGPPLEKPEDSDCQKKLEASLKAQQALETTLAELNKQLEALKQKLKESEGQITDYNKLKEERDKLAGEVATLSTQNENLESAVQDIDKSLQDIEYLDNETPDTLITKLDKVLVEHNTLKNKVQVLKNSADVLLTKLRDSENLRQVLQVEVRQTSENITNLTNQRNIFGGITGVVGTVLGAIGCIAAWRKTRTGIVKMAGEFVEQRLSNRFQLLYDGLKELLSQAPPPTYNSNSVTPPAKPEPPKAVPHEFYAEPPQPIIGTWTPNTTNYANYTPESTDQNGLGPVPPNHPTQQYTVHEVLNAIDEVAKRHPGDAVLSVVPQLVRSILEKPKRLKHKE